MGLISLFKRIIMTPAKSLSNKDNVVVVIDALDECNADDLDTFVDIIKTKWTCKWLLVLVSSRPQEFLQYKLNELHCTTINTEDGAENSDKNKEDIQAYLRWLLKPLFLGKENDVEEAVKILEKRSEYLFLYVNFVGKMLQEIEEAITLDLIRNEDKIPKGLGGIYKEYFQRLFNSLEGERYNF